MGGTIFLVGDDNNLTRLTRSDYDSENLFQRLLADHPSVLGLTAESDELLLIQRERAVPDEEGGGGRWSLDHLFVDREGVPVLVEVKRATDTRLRREVIGQMLDYAANGVAYWPLSELIEAFVRTCEERGEVASDVLGHFLDEHDDEESFWKRVEANLRAGRVRMLFVADRIPNELRRIIEFLNEQMRSADLLAVEVAQFVGENGLRTLVPTLMGQTERARAEKRVTGDVETLTLDEWLERFATEHGSEARGIAQRVLDWAKAEGCTVGLTQSQSSVWMRVLADDQKRVSAFYLRLSSGGLEIPLTYLKERPALVTDEARQLIVDRFNDLPGVKLNTQAVAGWPSFSVTTLSNASAWEAFQLAGHRLFEEVKQVQ